MAESPSTPRVLIVAGSDSGGGAGIQADIKTVTALRGYAMTAVTAVTVQDTTGVHDVVPIPAEAIASQMLVVIDDLGVDALKTGMLHDTDVIATVSDIVAAISPQPPLVVDPVMVATSGDRLIDAAAVGALRARLMPWATVTTPNRPEAEVLLGRRVEAGPAGLEDAAIALSRDMAGAVLVKGGHDSGETVCDVLAADGRIVQRYESSRIETRHTHGTGCTLASGIADGLGRGLALDEAVGRARHYVHRAIVEAPGFGRGHGPLAHYWTITS